MEDVNIVKKNPVTPAKVREQAEKLASGKITISNIVQRHGPKQKGWRSCNVSGYYFPPEFLSDEYAYGYNAILGEPPIYVLKKHIEGNKDDIASDVCKRDVFIRGKTTPILSKSGQTLQACSSSVSFYSERGHVYSSTYRRQKNIYTNFPTGFADHRGSKFLNDFSTLVFGIEIEMKFANLLGKLLFSNWVLENFGNDWACERDGSLEDSGGAGDCGLELVSAPKDLNYFKENLPKILDKAIEFGGCAYQSGNYYGTHVTTNIVSPIVGDRFVWMINSKQYKSFWQAVACRSGPSFTTYCPFKNIPNIEGAMNSQRVPHSEHKRATFTRSARAVETRIFQANLHKIPAIAYIEVLEHLHNFCASKDFDANDWFLFLQESASDNMNAFFKDFGIDKIILQEKVTETFQ